MARRKARVLSAVGVGLGWCACGVSFVWPGYWWLGLFKLTLFGATCAISGVTWWGTRGSAAEDRVDARLRELERLRSGR